MTQWSHKIKTLDKEKLLELQNEHRKKYGLRPLKRIQTEIVLYLLGNNNKATEVKYITSNQGEMYQ